MIVTFYADHSYYSQLSNNGGSATILHSINTLRKLGHKANVVAHKDNFTWFKHPKPIRKIPKDTDVCIAVTISDIGPMLKRTKAKPFYWCRLIENHQMPKRKLLKTVSKVTVLVNSENLRDWFAAHGIGTQIVYQGVDIEKWRDLYMNTSKVIGFLCSSKTRKNFDFAMKIVKRLGNEYKYVGYGADLNKRIKLFVYKKFTNFVKNAGYAELIKLYNVTDIWVATSTKEGLHNCPLEAALCGCAVVYPDAPLAGCSDHCIDGKTAWKYEALNVDSAVEVIKSVDSSRNEAHKDLIKSKIGTRKKCMKKLVEILN